MQSCGFQRAFTSITLFTSQQSQDRASRTSPTCTHTPQKEETEAQRKERAHPREPGQNRLPPNSKQRVYISPRRFITQWRAGNQGGFLRGKILHPRLTFPGVHGAEGEAHGPWRVPGPHSLSQVAFQLHNELAPKPPASWLHQLDGHLILVCLGQWV